MHWYKDLFDLDLLSLTFTLSMSLAVILTIGSIVYTFIDVHHTSSLNRQCKVECVKKHSTLNYETVYGENEAMCICLKSVEEFEIVK